MQSKCSIVLLEGVILGIQRTDLIVDVFGEFGYCSSALADQIETVKALVDAPGFFVRQGSKKC